MPKNLRDLGKLIVAKGFKKLPKVQKIAQSGHTERDRQEIVNRICAGVCEGERERGGDRQTIVCTFFRKEAFARVCS